MLKQHVMKPHRSRSLVMLMLLAVPGAAIARGPTDYDFDFITIDHPNNPAYDGPDPVGLLDGGRGSVPYVYRIARTEVTTAQWLEFVNTFTARENPFPALRFLPTYWGAETDRDYTGPGYRFRLRSDTADAGSFPVFGISWRDAAQFCNWLHNAKSADLSSLDSGAYDASTFATNPDGTFNDQATRNPDARFFIPSLDEWIKAAHYDPNRHGPGQEGYWLYSHASESFPLSGPPGEGETSAGLDIWDPATFQIPIGAYPETLSPWGLLDITGGAQEWTEEIRERRWRIADGHYAGTLAPFDYPYPFLDQIAFAEWLSPEGRIESGLRIASPVPSPHSFCFFLALFATTRRSIPSWTPRISSIF